MTNLITFIRYNVQYFTSETKAKVSGINLGQGPRFLALH